MTPRLDIRKLSVSYGEAATRRRVVEDVAFTLRPGEKLGVIGESGSGKSTIAHALLGLLPMSAQLDGFEAYLGSTALHDLTPRQHRALLGARIAFIPQEPMSALNPTLKTGRQVDLVLRQHLTAERRARDRKMHEALEQLQISKPERLLSSYPFELSGGQIQRILIAQAIALDASLIIADEPTTALDVTVQQEVLKTLGRLVDDGARSLIFISHSIGVVAALCDTVLVMRQGQMMEHGPAGDLIPGSTHPYTRQLIAALPSLSPPRTPLPVNEPEGRP